MLMATGLGSMKSQAPTYHLLYMNMAGVEQLRRYDRHSQPCKSQPPWTHLCKGELRKLHPVAISIISVRLIVKGARQSHPVPCPTLCDRTGVCAQIWWRRRWWCSMAGLQLSLDEGQRFNELVAHGFLRCSVCALLQLPGPR